MWLSYEGKYYSSAINQQINKYIINLDIPQNDISEIKDDMDLYQVTSITMWLQLVVVQ